MDDGLYCMTSFCTLTLITPSPRPSNVVRRRLRSKVRFSIVWERALERSLSDLPSCAISSFPETDARTEKFPCAIASAASFICFKGPVSLRDIRYAGSSIRSVTTTIATRSAVQRLFIAALSSRMGLIRNTAPITLPSLLRIGSPTTASAASQLPCETLFPESTVFRFFFASASISCASAVSRFSGETNSIWSAVKIYGVAPQIFLLSTTVIW